MRLIRNLSAFAIAGTVGISGIATARPTGTPPEGSIRPEVSIRFAQQDGRGDTGVDVGRSFIARGFIDHSSRPDNNVGQARHFALPLKSEITNRVTLGDGREASGGPAMNHAKTEDQNAPVKGIYKKPQLPIAFKTEIQLQITSGGEAAVDSSGDRDSDDPKRARAGSDTRDSKHARTGTDTGTHTNPKVYPGRHEHAPAVYEMSMTRQKTGSASSDSPGDKDAP